MKLKKAAKKARKINKYLNYVAVDGEEVGVGMIINAYFKKPKESKNSEFWLETDLIDCIHIGRYSGKKKWNKTLRRIK